MKLVMGPRSERLHSRTVVVTSNLLDTSFGPLPRRVRLDGGVLGIYAVRKTSFREFARLLTRLMLGSWHADDAVLTTAANQASLAIPGHNTITVMLDGEIRRLKTPLRFSIKPEAVAMLVPLTSPT
jgi:diacylglycerol kinase family enzyme